jgi:hypothetical protein
MQVPPDWDRVDEDPVDDEPAALARDGDARAHIPRLHPLGETPILTTLTHHIPARQCTRTRPLLSSAPWFPTLKDAPPARPSRSRRRGCSQVACLWYATALFADDMGDHQGTVRRYTPEHHTYQSMQHATATVPSRADRADWKQTIGTAAALGAPNRGGVAPPRSSRLLSSPCMVRREK